MAGRNSKPPSPSQAQAGDIAGQLSLRARSLVLCWDTDPDAYVDAYDEVEAAGLILDATGMPRLNDLGIAVRAAIVSNLP